MELYSYTQGEYPSQWAPYKAVAGLPVRLTKDGTEVVLSIQPNGGEAVVLHIHPSLRPFIRRVTFSSGPGPGMPTGILAYHLGREGSPDFNRPVAGMLFEIWDEKIHIRLIRHDGKIEDATLPIPASRQLWQNQISLVQKLYDLALEPEQSDDAEKLAELLYRRRLNTRPQAVDDQRSKGPCRLAATQFSLSKEFTDQNRGTPLSVYFDKSENARYALIEPKGSDPSTGGVPWVIVHEKEAQNAAQVVVMNFRGETDILDAPRQTGFVSLTESRSYRTFLGDLAKKWVAEFHRSRPIKTSLGDRIRFLLYLDENTILVRRYGDTQRSEGSENVRLFLLKSEASILSTLMGQKLVSSAAKGALLSAKFIDRISEESLISLQIPHDDPGQLQVLLNGAKKPAFILKTFDPREYLRERGMVAFQLNVILLALKNLLGDPFHIAETALHAILKEPRWSHVRIGYELIQWADGSTPWIIRSDEALHLKDGAYTRRSLISPHNEERSA